jgi:hypothetical protein
LTSSLAVILASLSQQQESDLGKKTPDTSGLTSATSSGQLDLFDVSLKMSKDTSVSDSEKSSATWEALVIQRRGEYSQRVKSAHPIRESESISWPTPATRDHHAQGLNHNTATRSSSLATVIQRGNQVRTWRTPAVSDPGIRMEPTQWPTPTVQDSDKATKKMRENHQNNLTDIVSGRLNPDWVEWLMGVPTGWTALDFWETE